MGGVIQWRPVGARKWSANYRVTETEILDGARLQTAASFVGPADAGLWRAWEQRKELEVRGVLNGSGLMESIAVSYQRRSNLRMEAVVVLDGAKVK